MSHCPYCGKKIAMSKAFCSRSCKENYFQLIAIQIPKPFMRRIFVQANEEQRKEEIEKFAKIHDWRLDLLQNKIEEMAIEMKYIDKDDKPIKLLMKDAVFVFLGVYLANFIVDQMGDMSQGSTISGGTIKTPAFTGDPAF